MRVLVAVLAVLVGSLAIVSATSAAAIPGARYLGVTSEVGTIDLSVSADGKQIQSFLISYDAGSVKPGCLSGGQFNAATASFSIPIPGGFNFDSGQLASSIENVWFKGSFGDDGLVTGRYLNTPLGLNQCSPRDMQFAAVTRPGTATPAPNATFTGALSANGTVSLTTSSPSASGSSTVRVTLRPGQSCDAIAPATMTLTDGLASGFTGDPSKPTARVRVAISGTTASGVYAIETHAANCPAVIGTFVARVAAAATGTPSASATPAPAGSGTASGRLIAGSVPASGGFGLVVFGGGTVQQLVTATGCPAASMALFSAQGGEFVAYVPGTSISAVNQAFLAVFVGGIVPSGTPFVARCV